MLQNVIFCIDSIVCNIVFLFVTKIYDKSNPKRDQTLSSTFNLIVILIIFNNALAGIVTSLFLKSLNSILKSFASALELIFTAVLSWVLFGIKIDFVTTLSIVIILFSTWLYSKNPVKNILKISSDQIV